MKVTLESTDRIEMAQLNRARDYALMELDPQPA